MSEEQRKAIVDSGTVYLTNGLKAQFVGWKNAEAAGIHSAHPGFWSCSWETAAAVAQRPNRRFVSSDFIWRSGGGWYGYMPGPDEFQMPADYERAKAKGETR